MGAHESPQRQSPANNRDGVEKHAARQIVHDTHAKVFSSCAGHTAVPGLNVVDVT
jgi:hypothetical protein